MSNPYYTINLGHARITFKALVDNSRTNVEMMTDNAAFPSPNPPLSVLATAADRLDDALRGYEFSRSKQAKEERGLAFTNLKMQRKLTGVYVQGQSGGDLRLITSCGFLTEKVPHALGQLPAPSNLRAYLTPYPNTVDLIWGGVKGRGSYMVFFTTTPEVESSWVTIGNTMKNHFRAEGLKTQEGFFRVVALGAAGNSPASDLAQAKAKVA